MGPVIGIAVVVVGFIGLVVLLIRQSGSGPDAARLVARSQTVTLVARLPAAASGEHRASFHLELGADASDTERLTEALSRSGSLAVLAGEAVNEAVGAWPSEQAAQTPTALNQGIDPALSSALRSTLGRRGVQLREVSVHAVEMTPALRHLAEVWLPRCTRGGPTGRSQSINGLEIHIDGVCGRGDIYTSTSRGAGTRRERTRSIALVEDPSRSVNYTIGKPTGLERLGTLGELMEGAAER